MPCWKTATIVLLEIVCSCAIAQTVEPRQVATYGPEAGQAVWEPAIIGSASSALSVFNVRVRFNGTVVGYAKYDAILATWTGGGDIPTGVLPGAIDGSAAYDSVIGTYLATATNGQDLGYSAISSSASPWSSIIGGPGTSEIDKPWIVSGTTSGCGQQFYVVYSDEPPGTYAGYGYRVTRNGGASWGGGQILFSDTGQRVSGTFCAQPVSLPNGGLVVAYTYATGPSVTFRFLRETDVPPPDCGPGTVTFRQINLALQSGNGPTPSSPIPLKIVLNHSSIDCLMPWPSIGTVRTSPQAFALDPSNPSRLFIAYHDVEPGFSDVNVYIQEIDLLGSFSGNAKPRVRVNTDNVPGSVQFFPNLTVDSNGKVGVVFYDDRDYHSQQNYGCDTTKRPKYDLYFAESTDHGATFSNVRLYSDTSLWCGLSSEPPALDWSQELQPVFYEPGDYFGVATIGNRFITANSGTVPCDADSDKSVIFSSLVTP